jgi:2,4-dienoyl-CoA reductase-like NADH-dependent reductase (Old Yellow Enzyme family)
MRKTPLYQLRSLQLRNRIAIPPMCQCSAEEGKAAERHMIHFGCLALSGAGLMLLEASTRALCKSLCTHARLARLAWKFG